MPDEIEMQKRANYFDLKRDEFMALEKYLLSGLSDRDLGLAEGGIVSGQKKNKTCEEDQ